jgi:non-specific serine/threonine protein kinase
MVAPAHNDMMPGPTRAFGRFDLRSLLGKSAGTMVWLAHERASGREFMLTMPREAPTDSKRNAAWTERTRHASRLDHPNLAHVAEIGVVEHWPFIAVERGTRVTLHEWLAAYPAPAPTDIARWIVDALTGLAYAHEAGVRHADLQLHQLLIDDRGNVAVMGLGVAEIARATVHGAGSRGLALDPALLRDQRNAAERDVLVSGVLLHRLLAGESALGIDDTARVLERMAPAGPEVLRLPWTTPVPVPEALRAIVNRATSPQERLRYRGARTFIGALNGWIRVESGENGGPVAVLLDRLHSVGHLPALPGLASRVARLILAETQRADEMAEQILPDMALSFELLRMLNSAQVQGTQVAGNGTVLTLRRAVALIGIDGVRKAANALRAWPGPLDDSGSMQLKKAMERVRLAGHLAQVLRPAGYDPEVVYLIAVMQNLGRLMVRYHFADEAEQIEQLMRPATSTGAAAPEAEEPPGMDEDAAAFAVLGVDIGAFGFAVARQWGFGEDVMHMIRRLPTDAPVRKPDTDGELLRMLASAANETVDAVTLLTPRRVGAALERIAERYGRVLKTTPRVIRDALQEAREVQRDAALGQSRRAAPPEADAEPGDAPAAVKASAARPAGRL